MLFVFSLGSLFIKDRDEVNSHNLRQTASIEKKDQNNLNTELWDGPVLWHKGDSDPIYLILVEKAIQKLHLYRFDGSYMLIKSYSCVTGENKGKKRKENDEKTPEGIYFNVKTYRDTKVTLFGDRAFGLNYPDSFDNLEGNRGSGIFIHGSNKDITPFSTNGCLVLKNQDLADLDKYIQFKKTPIIIGDRLPYRFGATHRDLTNIMPFLRQAMLPESYNRFKPEFDYVTVLGYKDRVVAASRVRIKEVDDLDGFSRLYLAGPDKNLLVLFKREWSEEKRKVTLAKAKPPPVPKSKPRPVSSEANRIKSQVESWRKAWERKRLNEYIAHYHPAFIGNNKNLTEWEQYKKKLNKKYKKISVNVSGLSVKINDKKAKAYFTQRYRSDTFRITGYKILEFKKKDGSWKIFREKAFSNKPDNWPA